MKQRTEDKFKSGIYVIQNNINQKKYVGKSRNIYSRIKQHVTSLNTKCKDENRHLINSWHKYGREAFTYYVIEYIFDENNDVLEKLLAERELYWINTLETTDREKGYNLRVDSDPEQRKFCSEASIKAHIDHKESYENAKEKLAYANRKYRIAKCNKETGEIIKIYEIIKDIKDENPDFYLQAIKGCCQGTKKSYKGFRWHYCDLNSDTIILKGMFIKE